jgi:diguanylate cyclase (GGDEF)-like protein
LVARDRLTDLFTADYLEEGLEQELARARRFGRELSLVLFEPVLPDDVKLDLQYQALKKLAHVCRVNTRQLDSGVRWGQWVLYVLPETSAEGARKVAEKVKEGYSRAVFQHPTREDTTLHLTCRYSIAVYPAESEGREECLRLLKERLEKATV